MALQKQIVLNVRIHSQNVSKYVLKQNCAFAWRSCIVIAMSLIAVHKERLAVRLLQ